MFSMSSLCEDAPKDKDAKKKKRDKDVGKDVTDDLTSSKKKKKKSQPGFVYTGGHIIRSIEL